MIDNGPVILATKTVSAGAGLTAYSEAFRLIDLSSFALQYQVACTGIPNIKLQLEQSSDGINWYAPDNMADLNSSVTDKNLHGLQLNPITVAYLRIKVTELTATVADSVVTVSLSVQKRYSS